MSLSEKLDELFRNVFIELTELSSFKFSALTGYELIEKQYNEHMKEIEQKISTSSGINSASLLRIRHQIDANKKGFHNLSDTKQSYINKIDKSLIIYACSIFDYFINQTISLILTENPELLSNEKKTIPYYELLLYTKDDIIKFTIEKFIHELSYKNISDRIKHLSEKFELEIEFKIPEPDLYFSNEINLNEIAEVFAIRNIIIHNQGRINKIFLETVKSSNYKLDEYIVLENGLIESSITSLTKAASSISRQTMMRYH